MYKFLLPHWFSTAPELADLHAALSSESQPIILDVGCGYGVSTRVLAKLYTSAKVVGVDYHAPSIDYAKEQTTKEGLDNVEYVCCYAASPEWHGRWVGWGRTGLGF